MTAQPPVRYIISCAARTGSSMLVHLLGSHPQVLSHGELFGHANVGGLAGRWQQRRTSEPWLRDRLLAWREEDPASFLQEVAFDAQGRRAVGFKFKTDEAFRPEFAEALRLIAGDPSIAVIHLRRRDLLAQYVSHQVVLRGGPRFVREPDVVVRRFRIDVAAALRQAKDVVSRDAAAAETYAAHPSIEVEYESIDTAAICRFLGVEPRRLTTPTRRIIPDYRVVLENYDEAVAAFERHGLATGARAAPAC
jgi:hypothetical protein